MKHLQALMLPLILGAAEAPPPETAELAASANAFAVDFYRQLVSARPDDNLVCSPLSASCALSMLLEGARGDTAAQVATALHESDPQSPERGERWSKLLTSINAGWEQIPPAHELTMANAMWVEQTMPLREPFRTVLTEQYQASAQSVDFKHDAEGARAAINQWVKDRTHDRIVDLMPESSLDQRTRLVLTNAVYFKGAWVYPFAEKLTVDGPFTLPDGTTVQTPMMTGDRRLPQGPIVRYAEHDGFKAAELPYKFFAGQNRTMIDRGVVMLILLPDQPDGLPDLEQRLSPGLLDELFERRSMHMLDLTMPRYRLEGDFDLIDTLKALGILLAFEPYHADLSGIAGRPGQLYVSAAVQKAYIDVDEKGTEAAAATGIAIAEASLRNAPLATFHVDRPFLFILREQRSGAVLFIGRVLDPR